MEVTRYINSTTHKWTLDKAQLQLLIEKPEGGYCHPDLVCADIVKVRRYEKGMSTRKRHMELRLSPFRVHSTVP